MENHIGPTIEDLVLDRKEIEGSRIANLLSGWVFLDKETHKPILASRGRKKTQDARILLYLAGARASSILDNDLSAELASPRDIEQETGIKGGTLRPKLREFNEKGFVTTSNRKYQVTKSGIDTLEEMLEEEEEEGTIPF